jgi:hypothetical protein
MNAQPAHQPRRNSAKLRHTRCLWV